MATQPPDKLPPEKESSEADSLLLDDLRVVMTRRSTRPTLPPDDFPPESRFDRFEIRQLLGEGGMARVYRAVDVETGAEVALKVLKREYQSSRDICARFEQEARSMTLIRHENVVRVYDWISSAEAGGIAMELLTGGSLRDLLAKTARRKRRVSLSAVVRLSMQAASGLGAAHGANIVHRDIKPANLMFDSQGTVKVVDFGIVLALERATWLTGPGRPLGTPAYMSPEQCQGERVGPATDVYSLGITMYELATGRLPFIGQAESPFAVMLKHIREAPPDPRRFRGKLPSWLAAVILKCLEKEPASRYPDGSALAAALLAGPSQDAARPSTEEERKQATRIDVTAIREQLKRLPQRAILSWACRCARRVQKLNGDPRLDRSIAMAESTLRPVTEEGSPESLSHALVRIKELRTASFRIACTADATSVGDAASHAALAAAAVASCAAARCAADAAADAAFVAECAVRALDKSGTSIAGFWQGAQRDYQKLLAAKLGPEGTIGQAIGPSFWEGD